VSFADVVRLEAIFMRLTEPPYCAQHINYLEPAGDPGIFGPTSVTWRVLSNPVSVFIGGVTAVLFELAEPSVRSGVWEHTSFRKDPIGRMQRTGLAAMAFTYGCRRDAEAATSRVRRLHERVKGITPDGQPYQANDPELLRDCMTPFVLFASCRSRLRSGMIRSHSWPHRISPGQGLF
jgi:uncharacterized protein (DUF2236 family)